MTIILSSRNVCLCLLIIFTLIFPPAIPASADHEEASYHLPENVKTPELSSLINNIEKPDPIQTDAQNFSNSITDAHSNSTSTIPEKQTFEVQFTSYDDADIEGSPPATGPGDHTSQDPDVLNDNYSSANSHQQLNPVSKVSEDNHLYISPSFSADLQQSATILSDSMPDPFEDMQKDGDYWLIETFSHLDAVRNALSDKYRLANDIDISEITNWYPIGTYSSSPFLGVFDGAGFTITGLMIDENLVYAGFFGYVKNAAIVDLHLRDVSINAGSSNYIGGLVGRADKSTIERCSVEGNITSSGNNLGGLVGYLQESVVEKSYSNCSVVGTKSAISVGGLVGYAGGKNRITNSYSTGIVSGSSYVGGLAGYLGGDRQNIEYYSRITDCYSGVVLLSSGVRHGGLVGDSHSTAQCINSFWDVDVSGQLTSVLGTGKTTSNMKIQDNFTDWDFANTWFIEEGVSYPIFRWQLDDSPPNPDDPDEPGGNPGESDGDGDGGGGPGGDDDDNDQPGDDDNSQPGDDSNDYPFDPTMVGNEDPLMMFNQTVGFNTEGLFFKLLTMIRQIEKLITLILEAGDYRQTDIQAEIDLLFAEITELFETNRFRLSPAEEKIILDKLESIAAALAAY